MLTGLVAAPQDEIAALKVKVIDAEEAVGIGRDVDNASTPTPNADLVGAQGGW